MVIRQQDKPQYTKDVHIFFTSPASNSLWSGLFLESVGHLTPVDKWDHLNDRGKQPNRTKNIHHLIIMYRLQAYSIVPSAVFAIQHVHVGTMQ